VLIFGIRRRLVAGGELYITAVLSKVPFDKELGSVGSDVVDRGKPNLAGN
jgi:hypothetical protein